LSIRFLPAHGGGGALRRNKKVFKPFYQETVLYAALQFLDVYYTIFLII